MAAAYPHNVTATGGSTDAAVKESLIKIATADPRSVTATGEGIEADLEESLNNMTTADPYNVTATRESNNGDLEESFIMVPTADPRNAPAIGQNNEATLEESMINIAATDPHSVAATGGSNGAVLEESLIEIATAGPHTGTATGESNDADLDESFITMSTADFRWLQLIIKMSTADPHNATATGESIDTDLKESLNKMTIADPYNATITGESNKGDLEESFIKIPIADSHNAPAIGQSNDTALEESTINIATTDPRSVTATGENNGAVLEESLYKIATAYPHNATATGENDDADLNQSFIQMTTADFRWLQLIIKMATADPHNATETEESNDADLDESFNTVFSADSNNSTATGESNDADFTLEDMKDLQVKFADEAMDFLLLNTRVYPDGEDPSDFEVPGSSASFTHDVGNAITTIAYIQRIGYRNVFRMVVPRIKDADGFEQYIMNFPIQKTDDYFYYFLAWVAHTFDFTIFCLKAGKDFVDEGRECIAEYPDVEYFHSRGGFSKLLEYSKYMAELYGKMSSVICSELPTDDVILPIMTAIELMEREERISGNRSNPIVTDIRQLREVRKRLSYKYEVMSAIDPRRITSGFKVQMKKSPIRPKSLKDICPKAAEMLEQFRMKPKPEKDEIDDLVEIIEKTRIAVELTHRSPGSEGKAPVSEAGEIPDSKYVFIVSGKFLDENSPRSKKNRCLKAFSPSKRTEKLVINLNEILDVNIANKNYSKIDDDVYAICPPGSNIEDKASRLIVFDLFSEFIEERNVYVNLKEVDEEIIKYVKKSKNRLNQNDGATVEETTKEGMPSDHTASSHLPEQESNSTPDCTGAIPKTKVHDIPAKSEADLPKEISTVQSKVSDPNNADETRTKKRKNRSRRRKHK